MSERVWESGCLYWNNDMALRRADMDLVFDVIQGLYLYNIVSVPDEMALNRTATLDNLCLNMTTAFFTLPAV